MFKPHTLVAAFGLARLQKEEVTRKHSSYRNTRGENNPYTFSFKPTPLRLPAPDPTLRLPTPQRPRSNPPSPRRNPYPIKCISPNQMYKRREKSYSTTQMQQTQLYLLEGMEFKEEGEEELEEKETFNQSDTETIPAIQQADLLGISLHAIAGAPSPKTMRLVGKIRTYSIIVLINTSSTHSFIDVNVARKAKLPVEEGHLAV